MHTHFPFQVILSDFIEAYDRCSKINPQLVHCSDKCIHICNHHKHQDYMKFLTATKIPLFSCTSLQSVSDIFSVIKIQFCLFQNSNEVESYNLASLTQNHVFQIPLHCCMYQYLIFFFFFFTEYYFFRWIQLQFVIQLLMDTCVVSSFKLSRIKHL